MNMLLIITPGDKSNNQALKHFECQPSHWAPPLKGGGEPAATEWHVKPKRGTYKI